MKCRYIDHSGYCRHRKNQENGRTTMKCFSHGCPFFEDSKINQRGKE